MNEVTTQQASPLVEFKRSLSRMIEAKDLALPSNVSLDAFRNAAIVAVQDNPAILNCEPGSVFRSLRKCAGAGLIPDGREAAIVPFKGVAQFMPMVHGLRKIARNSGEISSLWDEIVYRGETLGVTIEDGERRFTHRNEDGSPLDAMNRGGEPVGAYAVAKLKDGTIEFLPMTKAQIEKRRMAGASQRGKPQPDGVWKDWYEEKCRVTVTKALCNKLPLSAEDVRRIMADEDTDEARDVTPQDEAPAPRRNLAQRIAAQEVLPPDPIAQDGRNDDDTPMMDGEPVDLSAAFPGAAEWDDGVRAYQAGQHWTDCPHDQDREKAINWFGGYMGAKDAAEGGE